MSLARRGGDGKHRREARNRLELHAVRDDGHTGATQERLDFAAVVTFSNAAVITSATFFGYPEVLVSRPCTTNV